MDIIFYNTHFNVKCITLAGETVERDEYRITRLYKPSVQGDGNEGKLGESFSIKFI